MADKYFFGRTPFNNGGIARLNFANGTPGFYNAKDQAIYDAGDKFVPQTKYLQSDYIPTEGISYAGDGSPVSYANSGIMSGYMTPPPIIYPPIREGGGDGPPGPADPGSYDSQFDPVTQNKEFVDDIGEGTIAEEDDEETTGLSIVDGLRAMGAFAVGGPFNAGFSLNKSVNRNKQKEIDRINAKINSQYGLGGVLNDPNTVGGSSRDSASGGSFGSSVNEATGARGSGTGFSDYS
jgi:hypothetical protein